MEKILSELRALEQAGDEKVAAAASEKEDAVKKANARALTVVEKGKQKTDAQYSRKVADLLRKLEEARESELSRYHDEAKRLREKARSAKGKALDALYSEFLAKVQ